MEKDKYTEELINHSLNEAAKKINDLSMSISYNGYKNSYKDKILVSPQNCMVE